MRLALHTTPCCWWGRGRGRGSELANQTNRLGVELSEAGGCCPVSWVAYHCHVCLCEHSSPSHDLILSWWSHDQGPHPLWHTCLTFRDQWLYRDCSWKQCIFIHSVDHDVGNIMLLISWCKQCVSHLWPNPAFISPPGDTAALTGMCTSCVCIVVILVQLRTTTMAVSMTTVESCLN